MRQPNHSFHLMLCLVAVVLLWPWPVAAGAQAEIAPLAVQSLLLDGQVVGSRLVAVGERGHILVSDDQGRSWQQRPAPTRATLTSLFFLDPDNGWAAGHDAVILRTQDGGQTWTEMYSDPEDERPILDLWFHDDQIGFAVGGYGLFLQTRDGGETWDPVEFNPATMRHNGDEADPWHGEDDQHPWGIDYHLNQIAGTPLGRVYIAAEAGNLYRSDDGCRSWLSLPSPYEGSFYGTLPLGSDSVLLYGLRGHLFRSDDAGSSWQALDSSVQTTLYDGIRLRDGRIVLAGMAGVLLVSADDGKTFRLEAQPDRAAIARVIETTDSALLLLGEQGVRRLPLAALDKEGRP